MHRNIYLFIIWQKGRHVESRIREDLLRRYRMLGEFEISWRRRDSVRNFSVFYRHPAFFSWLRKCWVCGTGAFRMMVVEDVVSKTSRQADVQAVKIKDDYRAWAGGRWRVHGSSSFSETQYQYRLLTGKAIERLLEEPADGSVEYINIRHPLAVARVADGASGPHAHLLREHRLVKLGVGARRVCYRIGDTGYCVKFLRTLEDDPSRHLGWRLRRMLKHDRFDRRRNLNCLEANAMEEYRRLAGPAVAAALPETVEIVFDEKRGYGVLMSLLTNDDGTPVISADYEMAKRRDPVFVRSCLEQIKAILDELIACSAPFFEPDNFEAQVAGDGSVRIRMIDFEPCDKKFLPVAELLPTVRRMNLRRKAKEYLQRTAEKFDIIRT